MQIPRSRPLRVLVIGAGPAGLTTCKTLLHFPSDSAADRDSERVFDPVIVEADDKLGGTFAQRSYENGTLVSSKQLTSFTDYRFPLAQHDHVAMDEYVAYLKRYVDRFGLASTSGHAWQGSVFEHKSRLRLNTRVLRMDKDGKGGHDVTIRDADGELDSERVLEPRAGEFCLLSLLSVTSDTGKETIVNVQAVAVCTGLHVLPAVPTIPGLPQNLVPQSPPITTPSSLPIHPPTSDYPKSSQREGVRVIHSSQYKSQSEFKDRKVLILGVGETSMDLSYAAIQGGATEVTVAHRGGFLSFPKVLNDFSVFGFKFEGNLPIDGLITNLFETAYVHPWIASSRMRWHISDFFVKRVMAFLTGTSAGCGQWVGSLPPSRHGRAFVFLNSKAMPYINRPHKPRFRILANILRTDYLDPQLPDTPCKEIELAMWPSHIDETGRVHFTPARDLPQSNGIERIEEKRMKGKVIRPDLVVFCSGYRQDWSWLGEGYPKGPGEVDVREIADSHDLTVGWIGFVRVSHSILCDYESGLAEDVIAEPRLPQPGVGAIPCIAEQQAMLWSLLLAQKVPVPTTEPHYRLLASKTARIQYGVDHSAYMSTLAKDMGAAPSLLELYNKYGCHVTLCYAFGAAFGPFYRLVGPFAAPEQMREVVTTEIWETITRRGLLGNLFMGVIPMIFYGIVNSLAFAVELIWIGLGKPLVDENGHRRKNGSMKGEMANGRVKAM
ncbi:BZ3500_MvSof-1268-A1-R1_Chr1-3g02228 [Microbotryum saponariae]|uniref:BZ3500_MvSof-1268-A1-R1_Chr1-3g02228 protein n=1 Tax=Microbotryum saponariae TaxID=289078 RepID=A0A2X0KTQ4_9BASI|nr:BZ3500_MvSof-1268-A1-R1_Chr1-3g02228 [Microbotryum saponariae]SCZ95708.1 BZ3501_MvSof-1269-A2-R1_Chr1-3g01831 [Microbotryum saponariae]